MRVIAIATGDHHTCVILDDDGNRANGGPLKCWGYNEYGQLGLGTKVNSRSAQDVDLGTNHTAKAVATGGGHTCAILDDDSVKCWGFNYGGQLGLGHRTNQPTPQNVNLGTDRTAKKIVAGTNHTCAILDNDKVKCWGLNNSGQLGLGDRTVSMPRRINKDRGDAPNEMGDHLNYVDLGGAGTDYVATDIVSGDGHNCVILNDNSLKCWGRNTENQLKLGYKSLFIHTPQDVNFSHGRTAIAIAAGVRHTCAILDDNSLKCWGDNTHGQLGGTGEN